MMEQIHNVNFKSWNQPSFVIKITLNNRINSTPIVEDITFKEFLTEHVIEYATFQKISKDSDGNIEELRGFDNSDTANLVFNKLNDPDSETKSITSWMRENFSEVKIELLGEQPI